MSSWAACSSLCGEKCSTNIWSESCSQEVRCQFCLPEYTDRQKAKRNRNTAVGDLSNITWKLQVNPKLHCSVFVHQIIPRWVDFGWLPGAHQVTLSFLLFHLSRMGEENTMKNSWVEINAV